MYANAEPIIERILALVEKCPEALRANCFEILLKGYVDREAAVSAGTSSSSREARGVAGGAGAGPDEDYLGAGTGGGKASRGADGAQSRDPRGESQVPAALVGRFRSTAKRLGVQLDALEGLFDFSADPMDFHALHVTGKGAADKTRKVAMLVAARSYLTSGTWVADWQEVKAQCVNQSCYDRGNFGTYLKTGQCAVFAKIEVGQRVELNAAGIKEAEALLATMASES